MKKCFKGKNVYFATFIEYAMLVGLVAILVAVAAYAFSDQLKKLFEGSTDQTAKVAEAVKNTEIIKSNAPKK